VLRAPPSSARSSVATPVLWIASGSVGPFALAAAVINPVLVVGAGRVIGGVPIGRPRIRAASLAYAVTASSLYLLVAIVVRRALP
jgi:hypothetical protein